MNYLDKLPALGHGYIYCYTSPSGKKYIGQTVTSLRMRSNNNGSGYKVCSIFYSAIQKYGWENFTVEILEEPEKKILDEREYYWIDYYKTYTPYGYNIRCNARNNYSKRVKALQPIDQYDQSGKFIQSYSSIMECVSITGYSYGDICAIINHRKKHSHGYTFCKKGEKPDLDYTYNIHKLGRKTAQYTVDGSFIKLWDSAAQAGRELGIQARNIRKVCDKERQTAGGYRWEYLD